MEKHSCKIFGGVCIIATLETQSPSIPRSHSSPHRCLHRGCWSSSHQIHQHRAGLVLSISVSCFPALGHGSLLEQREKPPSVTVVLEFGDS